MGLRKLNIDRRTADQILQDMTPEEREQFERDCEEQLKCTHNGELLESIKADPSANLKSMEIEKILRRLKAGEFDAK